MDSLLSKRPRCPRADYGSILEDLSKPHTTGQLPQITDYELGLPSLTRREDVIIVAANHELKQGLVARFAWRPLKGPTSKSGSVALASYLRLELDGSGTLEWQANEIYQPKKAPIWPEASVIQLGSAGAPLRLIYAAPYRRLRLLFRGYMRNRATGREMYVRLNLVTSKTSKVFDFLHQHSPDNMRQLHRSLLRTLKKGSDNLRAAERGLVECANYDHHEHMIRLIGECVIYAHDDEGESCDDTARSAPRHVAIMTNGFHGRTLEPLESEEAANGRVGSARLMVHLSNGQGFSIVQRRSLQEKHPPMHLGYTCFEGHMVPEPLKSGQPNSLVQFLGDNRPDTCELQLAIETGAQSVCTLRRRHELSAFFEVDYPEDRVGWAWMERDYSAVLEDQCVAKAALEELPEGECAQDEHPDAKSTMRLLTMSLDELAELDGETAASLAGAKAASLAMLKKLAGRAGDGAADFKVAPGFVLTRHAHDLIFELNPQLNELQTRLEQSRSGELELSAQEKMLAGELERAVEAATLPDELRAELDARMRELDGQREERPEEEEETTAEGEGNDGGRLLCVVRSSSWGEDEEGVSAAGQLRTLLAVPGRSGARMEAAVKQCLASKFSPTALENRRQHGMAPSLPMGVVVQRQIACERAGVMFTCDPATGDERLLVIAASYGLGESVVSGRAEPDTIRVRLEGDWRQSPSMRVQTIKLGSKGVRLGPDGQESQVEEAERGVCCLSNELALRLARCGLQVARHERAARDLEWGLVSVDGGQTEVLYLFQARPVTGLDGFSELEFRHEINVVMRAEREMATRANIGEVLPHAAKPLNLEMNLLGWSQMGCRMHNTLSSRSKRLDRRDCEKMHGFLYESYHAFFGLRASLMVPIEQDKSRSFMTRTFELGFFGHELDDETVAKVVEASRHFDPPKSFFGSTRYQLYLAALRFKTHKVIVSQRPKMAHLRADLRQKAQALQEASPRERLEGLLELARQPLAHVEPIWQNHIGLMWLNNEANLLLSLLLARYNGTKEDVARRVYSAISKLIAVRAEKGAANGVLSAEIPMRIEQMANSVRQSGKLEQFIGMKPRQALEWIREAEQAELSGQLDEFLGQFGHRCYNEFEIADLAWRERPEEVTEMVQQCCRNSSGSSAPRQNRLAPPPIGELLDEVCQTYDLRLPWHARLLARLWLVPRCRKLVAMRELTKDLLIEWTDILRESTRRLAYELARQWRIPDAQLMYYMSYSDLDAIVREPQPGLVSQALRRRQLHNKLFKQTWQFDEVTTGFEILPRHLATRSADQRAQLEALRALPRLRGTCASGGRVEGPVCLVEHVEELKRVRQGDILVAHSSDVGFSPVFPLLGGIITEMGGLISHGAVVAREYGLPALIGMPGAMGVLRDGERVLLDADAGELVRLDVAAGDGAPGAA